MQILIKDNWALNLWDIAIAESMIDQLSDLYPWCKIILESSHPQITKQYFSTNNRVYVIWRLFNASDMDHVKKILSFWFVIKNIRIIVRLLKTTMLSAFSVFTWISVNNDTLLAYKSSDMIVTAGWDYLSKNYAYYLRLYELFLIKKLWKPIFLYAQSIWPFHSPMNWLIKKSLSTVDWIFARDDRSIEILKDIGVEKNVYRTADSVMLLKTSKTQRMEEFIQVNKITQDTIWCVIRDIKYTDIWDKDFIDYLAGIAWIIKQLETENKNIILIAPNNEDFDISFSLIQKYQLKSKLISTSDFLPSEIKFLLSNLHYLISWRMHPIILWTTAWTPVIWLWLEFKMKSYLDSIWLGKFSMDITPFDTEKCLGLIRNLEDDYDRIVEHMNQEVVKIAELSKKNPLILKEIYTNITHKNP